MGKLIKQIKTKDHFHRFSRVVEQAITDACHEALCETCTPVKKIVISVNYNTRRTTIRIPEI